MKSDDSLAVSSLETPLRKILSPFRSAAFDTLDDLMQEAFSEVGDFLIRAANEAGKPIAFDRQTCGLAPFLLQRIAAFAQAGTLGEWLATNPDQDRYRRISDFLDLYRIQLGDFRTRFPKAYQKWTQEEDDALLRWYTAEQAGTRSEGPEGSSRGKIRWREAEKDFGRNTNAIKIRLGRLGIDLGAEAGTPRR